MASASALKILVFLFLVNSVSLYLFYSTHPDYFRCADSPTDHRRSVAEATSRFHFPSASRSRAKPWPILPSYLPWSQNHDVPSRSCEGYFGNGFTQRVDVLRPSQVSQRESKVNGGWFRCFYSETLRSSICEGGKIRMHPEKIRMSNGGESLENVIGRDEEDELPIFESGAFDIEAIDPSLAGTKLVDENFLERYVPEGEILRHTTRQLIESIRLVSSTSFECAEWIEEPTILVTRFEYANLFHTITDWYSAYVSSRVTGLPNRPHVVFIDGHCKAPLEETWRALFSSVRYSKNLTGPVCFRHVVLSPLGYETALFKGLTENINCEGASSAHDLWQNPDHKRTARLSEFGEMIRAAFGFPVDRHRLWKAGAGLNVLFVRREDYLAHPRHTGKVESRLINEKEVYDSIKSWASNHLECKVNVINGLFAHMSMKEQVRAIQDASVIVGAHGAGLTHIISASPKTVVLEIISSEYRRPHFALIARWKGLEYHAINLLGSFADPPEVLKKLSNILKSLGC